MFVDNWTDQRPGSGNGSANYNNFRTKSVCEVCDSLPEVPRRNLQRFDSSSVFVVGKRDDVTNSFDSLPWFHGRVESFQRRTIGRKGFPASPAATGTEMSRRVDNHVTESTETDPGADMQLSVYEKPGAQAFHDQHT
jgi:hypothetical protein